MIQKTTTLTLITFVLLTMSQLLIPFSDHVGAQSSGACDGLEQTVGDDLCGGTEGVTVNSILATTLNLLSLVAGIAAVVMIMVAGLRYVTSRGDPNTTNTARTALICAVVGVVIVATSQIIVQFVLQEATQTPASQDTKL